MMIGGQGNMKVTPDYSQQTMCSWTSRFTVLYSVLTMKIGVRSVRITVTLKLLFTETYVDANSTHRKVQHEDVMNAQIARKRLENISERTYQKTEELLFSQLACTFLRFTPATLASLTKPFPAPILCTFKTYDISRRRNSPLS